jgi:hypothetical protein
MASVSPIRARRTWHAVTTSERSQRVRRDIGLNSAHIEGHRQRGPRLVHPHGSGYQPLHGDLEEVAIKGVLTSEVVGAAATDGVEGGNSSQAGEGAPSSAS